MTLPPDCPGAYVEFSAPPMQLRRMVAKVIEVCTGDRLRDEDLWQISDPCDVSTWQGRPVNWWLGKRDETYLLLHMPGPEFSMRPWRLHWSTALHLLRDCNIRPTLVLSRRECLAPQLLQDT